MWWCGAARSREPDRSALSGAWRGLDAEICHAIAVAVLGAAGRIEFNRTETQQVFGAVSQSSDAVFFLTTSEIIAQIVGKLIPGPAVFYETHALIVKENSAAR